MSSKLPSVAGISVGQRFTDKVAIITGANSPTGIGIAAAGQLAQNGAKGIIICDYIDSYLSSHAQDLKSQFPATEVLTRQFDAGDEKAVKAVVEEALSRWGRLDCFFANAGVSGYKSFSEIDGEEFMEVMRVNTLSVFLAAKYASKAMLKTSSAKPASGGSIIGTASVAGLRSGAGPTEYSASKAAVVSIMQTVAYQLAGKNIRCNAICPGVIETGMTKYMYDAARARGTEKKIGQLNPLKRGAVADEVARVVLFLASDEASYVNGQAWAVDGGLSSSHPYVLGKMA